MAARPYHKPCSAQAAPNAGQARLGAARGWAAAGCRGFIAFLVVGLLLSLFPACTVWADSLQIGGLSLSYERPWQRGTPAREAEMGSDVLKLGDVRLYVPDKPVALKTTPDRFRSQLERLWRRLNGVKAAISDLKAGGRDWVVCRHPSRTGSGTVFQLVTLQGAQAYNLLGYFPENVETLPESFRDLLAKVSVDRANAGGGVGTWHLSRTVYALPQRPALDALAEPDARRLAAMGMLTGYGLERRPRGLDWFLDGFVWLDASAAGERKQSFSLYRELDWTRPPEHLSVGDGLKLTLSLSGRGVSTLAGAEPFGARVRLLRVCARDADIAAALDALGQDRHRPLERLAARAGGGCGKDSLAQEEERVQAWATDALPAQRNIALPVPDVPTGGPPTVLVLALRPFASPDGKALGDRMVGQAGVYYVYVPGD